jgi:threonine synthase
LSPDFLVLQTSCTVYITCTRLSRGRIVLEETDSAPNEIKNMPVLYHSTNNPEEKVGFRQALLNGMASNYGLYMMSRTDLPAFDSSRIREMGSMTYAEIAHTVLAPFVEPDIEENRFRYILAEVYDESVIPVELQRVTHNTHILWLSHGPTYSFKDFAARFFGRVLDHFLGTGGLTRIVIVATSGDTGGAVADALLGLENVSNIVFFPREGISERQRRQMTTLQKNIHAFAVNGDFDVCQEIAKNLLGDREFARGRFGDPDRFTSANSISIGRLLPQAVYPFYAYSRLGHDLEGFITSIPSGNFGDMMGTVLAKAMGLPIEKIVCGVNENREYPEFLQTGAYVIKPSIWSPSTAMIVSHPSNLARLVEFYGGHMYDLRDRRTRRVIRPGAVERMPDLRKMRDDIYSVSVSNEQHYQTIRRVYEKYGIILDPHGAVGWKACEQYSGGAHTVPAVIYETADPGKFPVDIEKAIGILPPLPEGMKRQESMPERMYEISEPPDTDDNGAKRMSMAQYAEVKDRIGKIFAGSRQSRT